MLLENRPYSDLNCKDSTAIGAQWKEGKVQSICSCINHNDDIFIHDLMDFG
jgi:hypothetical protein